MIFNKITTWTKNIFLTVKVILSDSIKIRSDRKIKWKDLMELLKSWFPNADYVFVTDNRPRLIYREDMQRILIFNLARYREWSKEKFDCDNFADVFKGIMSWMYGNHTFGTVRVDTAKGSHMLNCFIDEYNQFWFVEPQTNIMFKPKDKLDYIVRHVVI